jgi:hypothetical protein
MKIELREDFKPKSGKNYWWVILAKNGNVLLTSETYEKKATRTRIAKKFSENTGIPVAE